MSEPEGRCPVCESDDWVLNRREDGDNTTLMAEFECRICGCTIVLNFADEILDTGDEFAPEFEDLPQEVIEETRPRPRPQTRRAKVHPRIRDVVNAWLQTKPPSALWDLPESKGRKG